METIDFNQVITENIGVVEGLLPSQSAVTADKDGLYPCKRFMKSGIKSSDFDLNDVENGYYILTKDINEYTNVPPLASGSNFILITKLLSYGILETKIQILINSYDPSDKYIRVKYIVSWSEWK